MGYNRNKRSGIEGIIEGATPAPSYHLGQAYTHDDRHNANGRVLARKSAHHDAMQSLMVPGKSAAIRFETGVARQRTSRTSAPKLGLAVGACKKALSNVGGLALLYSSTRPLARKIGEFRDFLVDAIQREWVG